MVCEQLVRAFDVSALRPFVTGTEQQDDLLSGSREVDPVPRPVIDTEFPDTATDGLAIPSEPRLESCDPNQNPGSCLMISAGRKPIAEHILSCRVEIATHFHELQV